MATYELLRQALKDRPRLEGVTPVDIGELPEPLRGSVSRALRVGTTSLSEMVSDLGLDQGEASLLAALLIDKGVLVAAGESPDGDTLYRVNLARRKGRSVPFDI
jgi:hypothetical protein